MQSDISQGKGRKALATTPLAQHSAACEIPRPGGGHRYPLPKLAFRAFARCGHGPASLVCEAATLTFWTSSRAGASAEARPRQAAGDFLRAAAESAAAVLVRCASWKHTSPVAFVFLDTYSAGWTVAFRAASIEVVADACRCVTGGSARTVFVGPASAGGVVLAGRKQPVFVTAHGQ